VVSGIGWGRLPRRRLRAALRDDEGELAAAVWIAAVVYCAILAAATAAVALTIGAVSDLSAGFVIFGVFFVVLAAAFGTVVGAVAGVPLGLLVAFGQRRLGIRVVATCIPIVAMLLTAAVISGWFGLRSPAAVALETLFTLPAALLIARRYEHLARERPVH
jgi:hypothetical protein